MTRSNPYRPYLRKPLRRRLFMIFVVLPAFIVMGIPALAIAAIIEGGGSAAKELLSSIFCAIDAGREILSTIFKAIADGRTYD